MIFQHLHLYFLKNGCTCSALLDTLHTGELQWPKEKCINQSFKFCPKAFKFQWQTFSHLMKGFPLADVEVFTYRNVQCSRISFSTEWQCTELSAGGEDMLQRVLTSNILLAFSNSTLAFKLDYNSVCDCISCCPTVLWFFTGNLQATTSTFPWAMLYLIQSHPGSESFQLYSRINDI